MNRVMITLAIAGAIGLPTASAQYKNNIGFAALQQRLGADTPTGAGMCATHVEAALLPGQYLPDSTHPEFEGKTINPCSGEGTVYNHATIVGTYYYGLGLSIAPGIDPIDAFAAGDWVGSGFLNNRTSEEPAVAQRRTQNHSWLGWSSDFVSIDILRRADLVVHRDGVVMAVAVNNGAGTEIPKVLASAYNLLAVGVSDGSTSYGPTTIDVAGRVKPDIVAPLPAASSATAVVTASAALLIEASDAAGSLDFLPVDDRRTAQALLVKALLMGGATKDEVSAGAGDWRRGFEEPSTDGTVPLDYRYGAGQLNIDNSHRILSSGRQPAGGSGSVGLTGWDFNTAVPPEPRRYFLEIPPGEHIARAGILVTWHRRIATSQGSILQLTPSLADINLHLHATSGLETGLLVDRSISSVDNVEHIYLESIPGGRYVFEITTDLEWDYAVTWDITTAPNSQVPGDFNDDGAVDDDDLDWLRQCMTGPTVVPPPPGCEPADLDGDGDVDMDDLGIFQRCYSGAGRLADPLCHS